MSDSGDETKRRRCHFSDIDTQLLVNITRKYSNVLNNRKNSGITPDMKTKAWKQITKEYNEVQTGGAKELSQLRVKYKNMKSLENAAKMGLQKTVKPEYPRPSLPTLPVVSSMPDISLIHSVPTVVQPHTNNVSSLKEEALLLDNELKRYSIKKIQLEIELLALQKMKLQMEIEKAGGRIDPFEYAGLKSEMDFDQGSYDDD